MDVQTTKAGGPSAGENGLAGQPGAGEKGVTTNASSVANSGQPDQTGQPRGNPETTAGVTSPHSGGLAQVFAGQPGAGEKGVTTNASSVANSGQPDPAGQPRGNPGQTQSNDLSLPTWTEQVSSKLAADPNSAAKLAAFKNLDDLVQAYLDMSAKTNGQQPALPGKDSTPAEIQAFYESLGKPKEAAGYSFATDSPDLAAAAFTANLSAGQADALYQASVAQLDVARNGIMAAVAKDFQATDAVLQKEYGERYDEALTLMRRGLGNNPTTGELSPIAQSLMNAGLAGKPEIVRAFIELGRATGEGTAPSGASHAGRPQSVTEGRGFSY